MTHIDELDRVLGGGIVKGSLVLIGGDPGIGKSTLLLQMCSHLVKDNVKVLYVSGEESLSQIMMRGRRLNAYDDNLLLLCDNDLSNIEDKIEKYESEVVIVDSIQTIAAPDIDNAPGTVTQVREVTSRLLKLAKTHNTAIFIVGHVTKDGQVAGPRTLEHMVDSVLYFEGDESEGVRLLRAVKNRFGSTNEIGVFNMTGEGLEEVTNPSQMFLNGRPEEVPGSVVIATMEGTRSVLVELQALVADTSFNMPRRTSVGVDYNRVNLLIAVLEKRAGIYLGSYDCYVNIAGGLKLADPASDLGVAMAIVSSFKNKPVPSSVAIIGEVGLAGEIRGVTSAPRRVTEAEKMGFKKIVVPVSNKSKDLDKAGIDIIYVKNIGDAIQKIFV
jgi:DNA repair protein RadA/Sms